MNRALAIIELRDGLGCCAPTDSPATRVGSETVLAGGVGAERSGSCTARAARCTGPKESTFVRASVGLSFPSSQASTITPLPACPPGSGVAPQGDVAADFRRSSSSRARGKCSRYTAARGCAPTGAMGRRRSLA